MATYHLRIVNSEFSCTERIEAADAEAARKEGLKAALGIGADEITGGAPLFAAEVRLERAGESQQRFLVVIGHSPLQPGSANAGPGKGVPPEASL